MPYVSEQTPEQLREHMKRITAMPGWHDPLSDRLWREIQALDAEKEALQEACRRLLDKAGIDA
jgi:hypothetical protein